MGSQVILALTSFAFAQSALWEEVTNMLIEGISLESIF